MPPRTTPDSTTPTKQKSGIGLSSVPLSLVSQRRRHTPGTLRRALFDLVAQVHATEQIRDNAEFKAALSNVLEEAEGYLGVVQRAAAAISSLAFGEARAVFQKAFALDSGNSEEIRQNLRLAIARTDNSVYAAPVAAEAPRFNLMRRGQGDYVLLSQL